MSKDTDNSLFINFSLPRFYQHLLRGIVSFEELGNHIIRQIKTAHAFRQVEQVRELSRLLINLPIKEYQLIGQYYLVWCQSRAYKYDNEVLETITEQTKTYKAKALLSRAGFEVQKGHIESGFYYYTKALQTTNNVSDYIELSRCMAVAKSIEGFHESALKDLERLIPLIRYADSLVYYDFLNSYAVELGEVGRKQEARNISSIVLSSPFAYAYPEWQDTANDLRGSQKSFVSVNSSQYSPCNVFLMPAPKHVEIARRLNKPARVLDLQKWKSKMINDKNENGEQKPVEEMSTSDMLLRAMQVFSNRSIPEQKRREMLKAIERILAEPIKPEPDKPDDEHGA